MSFNNHKKGFTLIELLVVIAIIGILSSIVISSLSSARLRSRDSTRISQIRQISYALQLYYEKFQIYPSCLKPGGACTTTLEGSGFLNPIPTDPSSGLVYAYAALGSGAACTSYHLGASLEDKGNKALLTGDDAAPGTTCTGSYADFSGLSFAAGGQQCNTTAGTAQPTAASNGETCYDVVAR